MPNVGTPNAERQMLNVRMLNPNADVEHECQIPALPLMPWAFRILAFFTLAFWHSAFSICH